MATWTSSPAPSSSNANRARAAGRRPARPVASGVVAIDRPSASLPPAAPACYGGPAPNPTCPSAQRSRGPATASANAHVSSTGQGLAGQVRLFKEANCVRIYVEKIGAPEYNAALADRRPADTLTVVASPLAGRRCAHCSASDMTWHRTAHRGACDRAAPDTHDARKGGDRAGQQQPPLSVSSIRQQHTRYKESAVVANEPKTTTIQSVYAQRLAEDIEANRKEQADITEQLAQLAGLEERLAQLRAEEAWLINSVQAALPTAAAPAETETAAGAADTDAAVPKPRQDEGVKSEETKPAAKKAPTAKAPAKKTTAKKSTVKKSTAKKAATKKTDEAPLHELIMAILLKTPGEPHLAREVLTKLIEEHPERATSIQVVRNNLEALVRKKSVKKSHQQKSAVYTAHTAADDAARFEGDQSSETAREQVPAAV